MVEQTDNTRKMRDKESSEFWRTDVNNRTLPLAYVKKKTDYFDLWCLKIISVTWKANRIRGKHNLLGEISRAKWQGMLQKLCFKMFNCEQQTKNFFHILVFIWTCLSLCQFICMTSLYCMKPHILSCSLHRQAKLHISPGLETSSSWWEPDSIEQMSAICFGEYISMYIDHISGPILREYENLPLAGVWTACPGTLAVWMCVFPPTDNILCHWFQCTFFLFQSVEHLNSAQHIKKIRNCKYCSPQDSFEWYVMLLQTLSKQIVNEIQDLKLHAQLLTVLRKINLFLRSCLA